MSTSTPPSDPHPLPRSEDLPFLSYLFPFFLSYPAQISSLLDQPPRNHTLTPFPYSIAVVHEPHWDLPLRNLRSHSLGTCETKTSSHTVLTVVSTETLRWYDSLSTDPSLPVSLFWSSGVPPDTGPVVMSCPDVTAVPGILTSTVSLCRPVRTVTQMVFTTRHLFVRRTDPISLVFHPTSPVTLPSVTES